MSRDLLSHTTVATCYKADPIVHLSLLVSVPVFLLVDTALFTEVGPSWTPARSALESHPTLTHQTDPSASQAATDRRTVMA